MGFNAKNFEIVSTTEHLSNLAINTGLHHSRVKDYAYILHDKDTYSDNDQINGNVGDKKEPHFHIYIRCKDTCNSDDVAKWFDVAPNFVNKVKGRFSDCLSYLTHANRPEKHQYDVSEVVSNFDWQGEVKEANKVNEIMAKIASGDIRKYNLTEFVPVEIFNKHKRAIDNAFTWRGLDLKRRAEELTMSKDIVWIYGAAGTGKTALAKQLAKTSNKIFSITSTGKNLFDEYSEEPCMILDDIRPDQLKIVDLLGVLDPFNYKGVYARYQNKSLQADMLICTSILSPEQYIARSDDESEDEWQLYRRINTVIEVTEGEIIEYDYDEELHKREKVREYPNVIKAQLDAERKKKSGLIEGALNSALGFA